MTHSITIFLSLWVKQGRTSLIDLKIALNSSVQSSKGKPLASYKVV